MRQASIALMLLAGCAAEYGSESQAVIYGEDDRREVFAHPDALLVELGQNAVGALVDRRLVDTSTSPSSLRTLTLSDHLVSEYELPLCEEELYGDQPVLASCSGVLIDDDLFLTASHCVPTQTYCDDLRVVFDFYYASEGILADIGFEDVYACASIEVVSYLRDYAILRLDRPVTDRAVAQLRGASQELGSGDRVSVLGFPGGIPMKIDDSGTVYRPEVTESFSFFADVSHGSSGSPVVDNRGLVVGVVSQGSEDDWDPGRECVEPEKTDDEDGDGVKAGYVFRALHELCNEGPGSVRLCTDPDAWCTDCEDSGCHIAPSGDGALWLVLLAFAMRRRRRRAH